ncbi:hypothetical protein [Amycolatopsis sp. WQ 127309]|uniref:hypothetical protein n=1 Tax=Amycolatopsis sp. WQ 127309 TaxID=2932773 RepID=UPI001FF222E8|nr:hypothetical protein [Amycolatopsis sp. WQ 127309]UOZ06401.1 hypothetical protein MUY22_47690 [Amycolatopsis sp. WQ 127309]
MRGRYWLPLSYVLLAAGLWLWTGSWQWLLWAVPIALVFTFLVVVSGFSMEFTIRRRWREMRKLAARIGAREGELVRESRRRWAVIGHQASMCWQTIRPGTVTEVRRALAGRVRAAGYMSHSNGHWWAGNSRITLTATFRTEHCFHVIPEGHVFTEICMRETL